MQEQIVLHRALIRSASSTEAIRLIEEGADVNALDDQGRTPLHVAAEMGQDKVIPSMLEAGADPAKVDLNGRSAFRVAVEGSSRPNTRRWSQRQINGCRKIAKLLKSQSLKRDEDRLIAILFDDNAAELQKLLDAGLDCESRIPGTIGAIFGGNPEMQAILGALGREINQSRLGATLLMWAAALGSIKAIKVLMNAGADPNLRGDAGSTALDYAKARGKWDAAKVPGFVEAE